MLVNIRGKVRDGHRVGGVTAPDSTVFFCEFCDLPVAGNFCNDACRTETTGYVLSAWCSDTISQGTIRWLRTVSAYRNGLTSQASTYAVLGASFWMTSAWARATQEFIVISHRRESISSAGITTVATLQRFLMRTKSRSLSCIASCFESLTPRSEKISADRTPTAATTIGPKTEPFPASSTPQITV